MRIATHTLGCKLNFAETSYLQEMFAKEGFTIVDFKGEADLYVINTCTVTSVAEKKCRTAIRQALSQNPSATVAVIGCYAQNAAEQIAAIPGVSIVLGNDRKHELLGIVKNLFAARGRGEAKEGEPMIDTGEPKSFVPCFSGDDRTRVFFKVQDGCDYFCTYCAIPFARGRSRSATVAETVAVAKKIAERGVREVVLTGVNTGTFGQGRGERFVDLLRELDKVEGVARWRISSIEPNLITEELLDFVAGSNGFLPHFHIPLQAGSDKVLKMMHRRYDTELYARRVEYIKSIMPDACIAADVIAGFNGEGEEEFIQGKEFIERLPISYLHVFPYSDRPNTMAMKLGERVPVEERRRRASELQQLSARMRHEFVQSQMGKEHEVLWEHTRHVAVNGLNNNGLAEQGLEMMQGWTENYIRLQRPYEEGLVGKVTRIVVDGSTIVENFACED